MAVVNASTWCAKFNGTTEGITETVWFEYSMNSDTDLYSMKTKNITASGIFNYSQCGMPLLPGYTYKVNAFNNSGNGTKETFAMPTITPHPTTTYEQYVDRFLEASDDPKEMIVTIWTPYTAVLGGFFFGILVAGIFFNMATKQRTVALTTILMMCLGGTMWTLFSEYPEFVWLAQTLFIAAMVGMIYWTITKRWRAT